MVAKLVYALDLKSGAYGLEGSSPSHAMKQMMPDVETQDAHYAQEYWDNMPLRDRIRLCKRAGVSVFTSRRHELPLICRLVLLGV